MELGPSPSPIDAFHLIDQHRCFHAARVNLYGPPYTFSVFSIAFRN